MKSTHNDTMQQIATLAYTDPNLTEAFMTIKDILEFYNFTAPRDHRKLYMSISMDIDRGGIFGTAAKVINNIFDFYGLNEYDRARIIELLYLEVCDD